MRPISKYSPRLKLIFDIIPGESSGDDLFQIRKQAKENGWITPDCRTLAIVTGEHTTLDTAQIAELQKQVKAEIPELENTLTAVVACTPMATALVQLFALDWNQPRNLNVFSTLPAAFEFLKLNPSEVVKEFPELENLP
ncbi:hypothetical protein VDG1235_2296 [Verrucomicrobiia bacterium DG1235]|nr:hypothetical protein VDG1235_2296 [Verrucomicrobiae bacterium DG1235]